jgi:hypothetical protein
MSDATSKPPESPVGACPEGFRVIPTGTPHAYHLVEIATGDVVAMFWQVPATWSWIGHGVLAGGGDQSCLSLEDTLERIKDRVARRRVAGG